MTELSPLFRPLHIGSTEAPNRVLMAPLTRNRAQSDGTPNAIAEEYYRQRASAGLIVSEATQITPEGKGYLDTPGIYNDTHVAAWRRITDAVHAEGGRIFLQLWHVGRISRVSLQPHGQPPVAPSAIRANSQTFNAEGFVDTSDPRALETGELPRIVADYVAAAERAKEAGFDGVEVHAANGYLLDQFLRDGSNKRTDAYGGSANNRSRLALEVTRAVVAVWGADRVGIRLSPFGAFNDMSDSAPEETFGTVYRKLDQLGLAYLHVVENFGNADKPSDQVATEAAALDRLRTLWSGVYIANGDFDAARAADWIARDRTDAVSFGRPFIANPDLPERYRSGAALNAPDQATFYGGGEAGYTDYPSLGSKAA
jgi:N-ethylmaleimide reductase